MEGEQEWIESPEGWGQQDSAAATESNDNNDGDNDEETPFDLFASNDDPHDEFIFDVIQGDGVEITKTLRLSGFKLDSDETAKSTGVTLWKAAPRLATYIMKPTATDKLIQGKTVLELGAGLGLCGIVAHHVGASQVVLTDGDTQTLVQMRQNVKQSCDAEGDIECRQLIWGNSLQLQAIDESFGKLDTILGADVIYTKESTEPLFDTVAALIKRPHGRFVLSRYTRWNDVSDEVVLDAAKSRGLECTQHDEGIYVFSLTEEEGQR